jgi:hypothetical protein
MRAVSKASRLDTRVDTNANPVAVRSAAERFLRDCRLCRLSLLLQEIWRYCGDAGGGTRTPDTRIMIAGGYSSRVSSSPLVGSKTR